MGEGGDSYPPKHLLRFECRGGSANAVHFERLSEVPKAWGREVPLLARAPLHSRYGSPRGMPEVWRVCAAGVSLVLSPEERSFYQRLHWIQYTLQFAVGVLMVHLLPSPKATLDWWIFFGILLCANRVVFHVVVSVGFRFWRRAFGHKYPE